MIQLTLEDESSAFILHSVTRSMRDKSTKMQTSIGLEGSVCYNYTLHTEPNTIFFLNLRSEPILRVAKQYSQNLKDLERSVWRSGEKKSLLHCVQSWLRTIRNV